MSWYFLFLFWPILGIIGTTLVAMQDTNTITLGDVFAIVILGSVFGPTVFVALKKKEIIIWRKKK